MHLKVFLAPCLYPLSLIAQQILIPILDDHLKAVTHGPDDAPYTSIKFARLYDGVDCEIRIIWPIEILAPLDLEVVASAKPLDLCQCQLVMCRRVAVVADTDFVMILCDVQRGDVAVSHADRHIHFNGCRPRAHAHEFPRESITAPHDVLAHFIGNRFFCHGESVLSVIPHVIKIRTVFKYDFEDFRIAVRLVKHPLVFRQDSADLLVILLAFYSRLHIIIQVLADGTTVHLYFFHLIHPFRYVILKEYMVCVVLTQHVIEQECRFETVILLYYFCITRLNKLIKIDFSRIN
nr:MAG TPA: hypothetical protein [Caudoviricetes sp.]